MDPGNFDSPAVELWYGGRRLPTPLPTPGNKCCARQLCNGSQRRLRGIQAKPEVSVIVSGIKVRRLMPLRIPPVADLCSAFVLAKANRRGEVLKWSRIGIGHMAADRSRIIRRVFLVGLLEGPGERL